MTLYHYTTREGFQGIKPNGLKPTRFSEKLDANYGEGWYFTDLAENTNKQELEKTLWGTTGTNQNKCHSFLKFRIVDKLIEQGRNSVYILPVEKLKSELIELDKCPYKYQDGTIAIEYVGGGQCPL